MILCCTRLRGVRGRNEMKHVNTGCIFLLRQIRRVLEGSQQGRNTVGFKKLRNLCLFPTSASVMGKNEQSFLDWEEKIISFPKSLWKINRIVSHTKTPSAQQTSSDTVNSVRISWKKEAPFAPFQLVPKQLLELLGSYPSPSYTISPINIRKKNLF